MSAPRPFRFLNTDLLLESVEDLGPLVAAFRARDHLVLHLERRDDGVWFTGIEASWDAAHPGESVAALLDAVEALPPDLRDAWDRCAVRALDVGYDCGDTPWGFTWSLPPGLLARMAAVGAELRVTLYPSREPDPA